MSKSDAKVAKRYAKALFESCSPKNYESVSSALQELSVALSDNALRNALLNPSLSPQQRSQWLTDLLSASCPEEASSLSNLFAVVIQNRRVDSVAALSAFFAELLAHYKKLLELEVTSAKELTQIEKDDLSQKVKGKLPGDIAQGVSFDWKTEADLLGGLQVRIGDKLLDGSVSGAINKIARQLRGQ
jgi:F-type H+-transporting ATPase subunit delta